MPMSFLTSAALSAILGTLFNAPVELADPSQEIAVPSVGRSFPSGARLGILKTSPVYGEAIIGDLALPIAPGLQIRDEANRVVLPTMLTGSNFLVLYKMDATENSVWRIWILTPEEIAAIKAGIQVVSQEPVKTEPAADSTQTADSEAFPAE